MNADWRQVYQEERRRPGYVINNGKPAVKLKQKSRRKDRCKPLIQDRRINA